LSSCCMANILGDVWQEDGGEPDWFPLQSRPDAHLHLYGKKTAHKGRKMGHFTVLTTDSDTAFQEAKKTASVPIIRPTAQMPSEAADILP
ncbi:hypothetical protein FKR61_25455, partial [Salmonella enterica subsp. enterica]|nr:hypothetical protein [Salmonella enterica subsp. enterica]